MVTRLWGPLVSTGGGGGADEEFSQGNLHPPSHLIPSLSVGTLPATSLKSAVNHCQNFVHIQNSTSVVPVGMFDDGRLRS